MESFEDIYQKHTNFCRNLFKHIDMEFFEELNNIPVIESERFIKNLVNTLYLVKEGLTKQLYNELVSDVMECFEKLEDRRIHQIKLLTVLCISGVFSKHFTSLLLDEMDGIIKQINPYYKPIHNVGFGERVTFQVPRHGDLINDLYISMPRISMSDYIGGA